MAEHVNAGDPRRVMELLWGDPTAAAPRARGPKPGLTVAAIVDAAIALADEQGLDALSMRKVADRLGRTAMALYTYIPGKSELLELMIDTVFADLPTDYDLTDGWRPAMEAASLDVWDFFQRHPWMLHIAGVRTVLGPHVFDWYETQLRIVDATGLNGLEMTRVIGAVAGYVRGAAKAVADARSAEQVTGVSDDDWWNARSPLLDEFSGDVWTDRYPVSTRLSEEHVYDQPDRDPDDDTPYLVHEELVAFEFGLARLLDGIDAYVATKDDLRG